MRRLMYQPLIWLVMPGDDARGLRATFDAERLESETNALIDRMRRDVELGGDLFRRKVLVDEEKAIELALGELRDSLSQFFVRIARIVGPRRHIHEHISEQTVPNTAGKSRVRNNLRRFGSIEQIPNEVVDAIGCSAQPSFGALTSFRGDICPRTGKKFDAVSGTKRFSAASGDPKW